MGVVSESETRGRPARSPPCTLTVPEPEPAKLYLSVLSGTPLPLPPPACWLPLLLLLLSRTSATLSTTSPEIALTLLGVPPLIAHVLHTPRMRNHLCARPVFQLLPCRPPHELRFIQRCR